MRRRHTTRPFHFPRRKSAELTPARPEYAAVIEMIADIGPRPVRVARSQASGISVSQNTPRLIQVGVHVPPAPLNDCVTVMPKAYKGKPSAIVRSPCAPTDTTAASRVNAPTIVQHADPALDGGRDGSARHAKRGEGTEPEDQQWPEDDVDAVCRPEHAHRGRIGVAFANATRDRRRRADGEPDGERVDDAHHRLGEAHGGDGGRADVRDPEHVHDREDALHRHLERHRDGEQEDGAASRAGGIVVALGARSRESLACSSDADRRIACGGRTRHGHPVPDGRGGGVRAGELELADHR